jgi:hypothetical protein
MATKKPAKKATRATPTIKKRKAKPDDVKGRPSNYKKEYANLALQLCLLGATDAILAEEFEVTEQTINNWKKRYESFALALRSGKRRADAQVAHGMFKRALGYEAEEWRESLDKDGDTANLRSLKHIPGDVSAQMKWLKNRNPENWKETISADVSGTGFNLIIHEELKPPKEEEAT